MVDETMIIPCTLKPKVWHEPQLLDNVKTHRLSHPKETTISIQRKYPLATVEDPTLRAWCTVNKLREQNPEKTSDTQVSMANIVYTKSIVHNLKHEE